MTIPLFEFDPDGVDVTDEIVRADESVSINAVTYYKGYLNYIPNSSIYGEDSTNTYGVWTAALEGGERHFVLIDGLPADATQVSIDLQNGVLYSTTSQTVYVTYKAHAPIKHNINNVSIDIPEWSGDDTSETIRQLKFPFFAKFAYATVNVYGPGSASTTFTLSNGTETQDLVFSTNGVAVTTFTDVLKIVKSETLTLSTTDGNDANGILITLWDL